MSAHLILYEGMCILLRILKVWSTTIYWNNWMWRKANKKKLVCLKVHWTQLDIGANSVIKPGYSTSKLHFSDPTGNTMLTLHKKGSSRRKISKFDMLIFQPMTEDVFDPKRHIHSSKIKWHKDIYFRWFLLKLYMTVSSTQSAFPISGTFGSLYKSPPTLTHTSMAAWV